VYNTLITVLRFISKASTV